MCAVDSRQQQPVVAADAVEVDHIRFGDIAGRIDLRSSWEELEWPLRNVI